ncbi:hypothetical protein AWN76_004725 [Rhodothermaceae bacterium RA]|nr:hypothetical protein AWN76_004725 [Rhodothermaceae bacterium RA]
MRACLIALLVVLVAACGSLQPASGPAGPRTVLEVENRNFLDMNLYVLRAGQRVRLGRIGGGERRAFTIPDYVVRGSSDLQFLADPVGSARTPVTMPLAVTPGDRVRLIIPPY